jgi:hypothetical protein|tara:strand:- start:396 stop:554 length:159 start_codon:yes stop_codon:yes gene_type:complete
LSAFFVRVRRGVRQLDSVPNIVVIVFTLIAIACVTITLIVTITGHENVAFPS